MTTPPMPPRPSAGRSSFAIAMKDYTFIRPGIAVTVSAVTLIVALILGSDAVTSWQRAAGTVRRVATAVQTLHRYSAGLEVWRQMATSTDPAYKRPEALAQRDGIRSELQGQLSQLVRTLPDTADQELVHQVLEGLSTTDPTVTTQARTAMIVLLAHEDNAMFQAAEASQRGVLLAAGPCGPSPSAPRLLGIPTGLVHHRSKTRATIEVKI